MIPFEEKDGSVTELSAGQAFNRMMGDPDKEVRQRLFTAWEKAWSGKASILADTNGCLFFWMGSVYLITNCMALQII